MVEELWGEIPVRLGISQAEREAVTTLQQVGEGGGGGTQKSSNKSRAQNFCAR